ncbi:MAG: ribonuclease HIII [candidate division Zixibacteria bacterium]|jgi:ribonuclease HIII|nr:ribonuclease HIII [candidate division Zixibacteria bacterium]
MRIIGIDESGKGDFFGPLVIAALVADSSREEELRSLGVRDSKTMTPGRIASIAEILQKKFVHSVVVVGPEKYNQLYKKIKNLNRLLGWGHARAIENVLMEAEADLAISDKFADPRVIENALLEKSKALPLQQLVRGESVIQVAAASVIARATFVKQLERLSGKYGVELPKGAAAQVDAAGRELVRKYGPDVLAQVAKIHFKNYRRATDGLLSL